MEGTHDNDDVEFSFVSLAALTANVVRYLQTNEKKDEPSSDKPNTSERTTERVNERRAFVERRLRDLDRFEDRARGRKQY
jgi:hypothetical protein